MGKWIQRASMPTPRHDLQAIAVDEQIYAISGGGDLTSDVVEIYDVEHDTWSQGPSITTKRGWFGAVLLAQKIYAMGGKTVRTEEEIEQTGDPGKYDIRDSIGSPGSGESYLVFSGVFECNPGRAGGYRLQRQDIRSWRQCHEQ